MGKGKKYTNFKISDFLDRGILVSYAELLKKRGHVIEQ